MTAQWPTPVRVAFLGDPDQLAGCTPESASDDIQPWRVEWGDEAHSSAALTRLGGISPDVVVVFRPQLTPPAAVAGVDAITVGYLTEPIAADGPDVLGAWKFDRLVAASPAIAAAAELAGLNVWRLLATPVADRFYRRIRSPVHHPRVLRVHDALDAEEVGRQLDVFDVAFSRAHDDRTMFEHVLLVCLAGGLLVVSEPLDPATGLEPDIDFVSIDERGADEALDAVLRDPDAFRRQWIGGRMKAERWRASAVWCRLVSDLARDLTAFGRRAGPRAGR